MVRSGKPELGEGGGGEAEGESVESKGTILVICMSDLEGLGAVWHV